MTQPTARQSVDDARTDLPLPIAAAVAGYGFVALLAPQTLNDGDTYSHIATGQWILSQGMVPSTDVFSYSFAGAPWVAHEWLAEVVLALAYRAGAWGGVILLTGAAFALTLAVLAAQLRRAMDPWPTLLTLLLAAACVAPGLLARPHMLALPILAAWSAGLLQARRQQDAPSLWLLPLMALWANLHGGFIIGLALAAALGLERVMLAGAQWRATAARWGRFLLAALVMALATPQTWRGLIFPFELMGLAHLSQIREWQPTNFASFQPIEAALLALLYIGFSRGIRLPVSRLLLLLVLLHEALQHSRHQQVAGVVGALLLAEPLGQALAVTPVAAVRGVGHWRRPARTWQAAGIAALLLISALRLAVPIVRRDDAVTPLTALGHVPAERRASPVFNDYSFGGYLIFQGVKPFIDARADLYGDEFLAQYADATAARGEVFARLVERYGLRWTILAADTPLIAVLDTLPGWHRLYADPVAVVHVRD